MMPLIMASTDEVVEVAAVRAGWGLQRRLADMGLTPGVKVRVINSQHTGPEAGHRNQHRRAPVKQKHRSDNYHLRPPLRIDCYHRRKEVAYPDSLQYPGPTRLRPVESQQTVIYQAESDKHNTPLDDMQLNRLEALTPLKPARNRKGQSSENAARG